MPDDLVSQVSRYSKGKNITESLVIALQEWLALKKISALNHEVKRAPLKFRKGFSASRVRKLSRQ